MVWAKIQNHPNYKINELGEVYSNYKKDLLKPRADKKGYLRVNLDGRDYKVHRLVAQTFIPNINNFPQINHKDENKSNNKTENLEWCTNKYNCSYGNRVDRILESRGQTRKIKENKSKIKPVYQYTLSNVFVKEWKNAKEVKRKLNIDNSDIGKCCKGMYKQTGGYIWSYKHEIGV